ARPIEVRAREGDLAIDVERGACRHRTLHQATHEATDDRKVELQVGGNTADQGRGWLEAEWGPPERRLLGLIQPDEVDPADGAKLVACGDPEDRRRCDREEAALLESRRDRRGAAAEQSLGIEERDQAVV